MPLLVVLALVGDFVDAAIFDKLSGGADQIDPKGLLDLQQLVEVFQLGLKNHLEDSKRVKTDDGYIDEDPTNTICPNGIRYREDEWWAMKRSKVRRNGQSPFKNI